MNTKLDYYRIFYETARHSSFSAAAKELYISQSAISQCIQQLEKDLGTTLFVRSRRGVSLTTEGELLFQKTQSAISAIEQGEELLKKLQHLEGGSLIIAAGDTITRHYLLPYLEKFHSTYPDIHIEMFNSYSDQMMRFVKEGKAELAFVNMPVYDDELHIEKCFDVHDIFVCSPKHNIKKDYSWGEMAKEPLILLEENSSSRRFIDNEFAKKGLSLEPQFEIAAHDLLIHFASIDLGVSCVIEEFSKENLDQGLIVPMNLNPPLPVRSIGCAYVKNSPLSKAAQTFLKLINNNNYYNTQ